MGLTLGIEIDIGDWDWGIRLKIVIMMWEWNWRLRWRIGNKDWRFELGIRIEDRVLRQEIRD